MRIQHSSAAMIHQMAVKQAQSPQTLLALVAKLRVEMAQEIAEKAEAAEPAPASDIEAAESLVDKHA